MVMAEPVVFRREWVVQINAMLHNDDDDEIGEESGRRKADAILRVATPLLNIKPEAYIPRFLSIGPYHHSNLEKDIESSCAELKISTAEMYKAKSAAMFSQELRKRGKGFKHIVDMMEQMWEEIEHFYHFLLTTDLKNFALMMAVDSSFLLHFLIFLSTPRDEKKAISLSIHRDEKKHAGDHHPGTASLGVSAENEMIELGPLHECIKCDIVKLENQIPLAVLRAVFGSIDGSDEDFDQLLQNASRELSPFSAHVCNDAGTVNDIKHLLGCMHAFIAPILQMPSENDKHSTLTALQTSKFILDIPIIALSVFLPNATFERRYEIALNAEKLAKGRIQFKPFYKWPNKIRFDEYSGTTTLYLPEINIWETHTEVLLRNMVAMEFNDPNRGNSVMRYVSLMNCLFESSGIVASFVATQRSAS